MASVGFGYIPDEPDSRDLPALVDTELVGAPAAYDARHLFGRPFNQNGHNSCVVQAVVKALRGAHVKEGHVDPPNASRLLLWALCRGQERLRQNVGTQIRLAFKKLNRSGFCKEEYFPHSLSTGADAPFRHRPPRIARKMAYDQREIGVSTVYRRIYEVGPKRLDRIRECVSNDELVIFGTDVGRDFADNIFDPTVALDPPTDFAGRHAMVIVGYLPGDVFVVGNSYGENWGDKGFCLMSGDYLTFIGTRDLWVVQRAPWFSDEKEG